jgi:Holliday junction DNA helicase RuvA
VIGYIQGKVLDTDGKKAIVLTESGIGYEINYGYFANKDTEIGLFIHHHITDNDASLWGFKNLGDKKMFEFLKTVNKVGSSKAYPLITNIGIPGIIEAIIFDRPNVLSQAPGIGKKMAEQIILSLRDKVEKFQATHLSAEEDLSLGIDQIKTTDEEKPAFDVDILNDVLLALDSLGYKDKDMSGLVKKQFEDGLNSSEDIIKQVLKEL